MSKTREKDKSMSKKKPTELMDIDQIKKEVGQ